MEIASESAEIDLLTSFDEYFPSGVVVVSLATELCIHVKLGYEELLATR